MPSSLSSETTFCRWSALICVVICVQMSANAPAAAARQEAGKRKVWLELVLLVMGCHSSPAVGFCAALFQHLYNLHNSRGAVRGTAVTAIPMLWVPRTSS